MKFVYYIEKISGIDMFGLSSLILFIAFFTLMVVLVFRMKPTTIDKLKNIPLK